VKFYNFLTIFQDNGQDLEALAEKELLNAAKAIEMAAQKLNDVQVRSTNP
jgi:hypothetical protein